jgi:hypothetical protein
MVPVPLPATCAVLATVEANLTDKWMGHPCSEFGGVFNPVTFKPSPAAVLVSLALLWVCFFPFLVLFDFLRDSLSFSGLALRHATVLHKFEQ